MLAAAMLAAADESEPRPGGTPPWPTMLAITAIRLALWSCSSTLYCWCRPLLLRKISFSFVVQLLLLLLFNPPASEPAEERRPLPEELSLWALGEAHMGLPLANKKKSVSNVPQHTIKSDIPTPNRNWSREVNKANTGEVANIIKQTREIKCVQGRVQYHTANIRMV
jgi:hypothetical protein